jgi:predicted small lipoprotein YifL
MAGGKTLPRHSGHNIAVAVRSAILGRPGIGEFTLVRFRSRIALALAGIAAGMAVLALAGCGRNGPLELPPGPATATPTANTQLTTPDGRLVASSPDDTALKTGFDAQGRPVATPGEKKSFILDPLLR